MATAGICVPRGSPSCPLELLQDQQVCLTQAYFKWSVRGFVYTLREQSIFSTALQLSCMQSLQMFELAFSSSEARCEAWIPCSLGWTSAIVIIFLFVGRLPAGVHLDYTKFPSFLPIFLWFLLYVFRCGRSFLLAFRSFSLIVAL